MLNALGQEETIQGITEITFIKKNKREKLNCNIYDNYKCYTGYLVLLWVLCEYVHVRLCVQKENDFQLYAAIKKQSLQKTAMNNLPQTLILDMRNVRSRM